MGWAARANPRRRDTLMTAEVRRTLALFPDRATYERWLATQDPPEEVRAHLETLLPSRLQAQGHV